MGDVVIWGEVLFCIDFCMDFCALYFTAKLLGLSSDRKRLCAGALICASAGVFCTAMQGGLLTAAVSAAALFLAAAILIPKVQRRIRSLLAAVLLFLFFEACTGGVMTALFYFLNRQFVSLGFHIPSGTSRIRWFFLAAATVFFLLGIISRMLSDADVKKLVQRGGEAIVRIGGREASFPCLFDSGNLVREPISGKPVVFIPSRAQMTLGIDAAVLDSGGVPGSRLIPMKTLDAASLRWGICPEAVCLRADDIAIGDAAAYVVFSDQIEHAIVPTALLRHHS